jgi:hypothetical protein
MTFVGHRKSVVGVALVYNPIERVVTVDEGGTVKVWNIDKAQGVRATILQSVMVAHNNSDLKVVNISTMQRNGIIRLLLYNSLYRYCHYKMYANNALLCIHVCL